VIGIKTKDRPASNFSDRFVFRLRRRYRKPVITRSMIIIITGTTIRTGNAWLCADMADP
jgi:hypothetical protein